MGEKNLFNDDVTLGALKGYLVGKLESMESTNHTQNKNLELIKNDMSEVKIEMRALNGTVTDVKSLKKVIYGDKEGKSIGLIGEHEKLKLSHKIKSGSYGLVGGSIVVATSILMAFVIAYLRGRVVL